MAELGQRGSSIPLFLLGMYLPSAINGVVVGLIAPTIPALAATHHVSAPIAAQIVTAQIVGRFVTLIPSGAFADRFGGRLAMIIGALLLVAAGLATAISPVFWGVLAAQAVSGVGNGLWMVGRELASVDLVPIDRRGMLLTSYFGVSSAAQALGPLLGGVVTDAVGERPVFLLQGALSLVVLALAALVPEELSRRRTSLGPMLPDLSQLEPRFRATFLVLLLATLAAMLRTSTLNALLPLLGAANGFSGTQIGELFAVVAVVNLIMIGPAGYVSDRFGRRAATIPTAALAALAFVLYPFVQSFAQFAGLSVLIGVASGFGLGSMTAYTYDIAPVRARGTFQSFRRMAGDFGGLIGPSAGGLVAGLFSVSLAFLVFAPLHLAAALLLIFVARESLPPKERISSG